jgi:hypothetical protein
MANPTVSASLNKSSFAPGEQMTLTVSYGDVDNDSLAVTIVVTDSAGNSSAPVVVTANIADPVTVSVTDDGGRTWTKQSDNGAVAVYRAVA